MNRVHPSDPDERSATTITARLAPTFGAHLARRVAQAHTDVQLLARRDALAVAQLRAALHDPDPICLADRDRDLHDIRGLVDLHSDLFG